MLGSLQAGEQTFPVNFRKFSHKKAALKLRERVSVRNTKTKDLARAILATFFLDQRVQAPKARVNLSPGNRFNLLAAKCPNIPLPSESIALGVARCARVDTSTEPSQNKDKMDPAKGLDRRLNQIVARS